MTVSPARLHNRDNQAIQLQQPVCPNIKPYMHGWQSGREAHCQHLSQKGSRQSMKLIQYCLLLYLRQAGAITPGEINPIAHSLGISDQKVKDTLQGLVKERLVRITIG